MNITISIEYGLLAVGHVAKNSKVGLVKASTISKKYSIPELYLSRIMKKLTVANILKGKRGPGGGYLLARPLKEISMLEIIEAVGGKLDQIKEITRYTKPAQFAQFAQNMEIVCKNAVVAEKNILHQAKLSEMIG